MLLPSIWAPKSLPTCSMRHAESRYSRQIRFAPLGEEGQAKIRAATVAIVGCGALGTVQAEAMARAGVGRLRIIDRDFVEWSNLQRQFLFEESDAAEALPKAVAAARRLARVNSEVTVEPMVADLTRGQCRRPVRRHRSDPRRHRQFRDPLPDQ